MYLYVQLQITKNSITCFTTTTLWAVRILSFRPEICTIVLYKFFERINHDVSEMFHWPKDTRHMTVATKSTGRFFGKMAREEEKGHKSVTEHFCGYVVFTYMNEFAIEDYGLLLKEAAAWTWPLADALAQQQSSTNYMRAICC